MKKLIFVLPAFVVALLFLAEPTSAQIIDIMDTPRDMGSSTSYGGGSGVMASKMINFVLYFISLVSMLAIFVSGPIGLILLCFKKTRKAGKIMSIIALVAIGVAILTIIGFAIVNTFMTSGVRPQGLY